MTGFFRTVKTLLCIYYAYMMEYRAELLLWALSGSLPFILMGIWMQASEQGQFSLQAVEFARYFLAAFIVRQLTVVWVIWEFEKEVVNGTLSPKLLQPLDPAWHHVTSHLAERVARTPFILGLILLFFALYPESFWLPSFANLCLCLAVAILAFSLRFVIQHTFALCAFWIERASAIEQFWFLPYLFLSGMVAPLDVFPEAVRAWVIWTPFPYLIYFPAALLLGWSVNILQGISVMSAWGLGFWFLNRWLWRRGLKRYSGMGA